MGDGEAMRLIAYPLQKLQLRRRVLEDERAASAGNEELLDSLGEGDDGDAAFAEALAAGVRPAAS